MNNETMLNMMEWLCERRQCARPLTGPVMLEVTGAGNLTVLMHEEPAAKVEEFAAMAVAASSSSLSELLLLSLASLAFLEALERGRSSSGPQAGTSRSLRSFPNNSRRPCLNASHDIRSLVPEASLIMTSPS